MRAYSVDLRQKIIDTYHSQPISQRQLAHRFTVALSFVQKIIKQDRTTGSVVPKPHQGGSKLKLTGEQLAVLAELIESNNDATLAELCVMLESKTGVVVSRATMGRMTNLLNITVKKTQYPDRKYSERVQILRAEFWEEIRDIKVEDLIFIDESGVNIAMVRLFARAKRGQRARAAKPSKRGKNVSIIGAISVKEIVTSINLLGGIDNLTFTAFVHQKLWPKIWKGACVLMDNYRIHKGEDIDRLIESVGGKVIYLPAYSPDFSPIENMWSKVKQILRTIGARTYHDLESAIANAFDSVTKDDLIN